MKMVPYTGCQQRQDYIGIDNMAHHFKLEDSSLLTETGWINGKPARTVSGRAAFAVHDPATDKVWAHQESMDAKDADLAVEAATAAFPPYAAMPPRQRARLLLELDRLFRSKRHDFAQLVVMETGKAYHEALAEADYAGE
jgi:acyl-CoA reductase-like NAD-dependent aldehyde dehydrogenase